MNFSPKSLHLLPRGIYSNHLPKAQGVIAWRFIAPKKKLSFQNHLFREEKMEQNSSFYPKHCYLAVFTFARHKAAILIFRLQGLPQVLSSIVRIARWIELHFACWYTYFFFGDRKKLQIKLQRKDHSSSASGLWIFLLYLVKILSAPRRFLRAAFPPNARCIVLLYCLLLLQCNTYIAISGVSSVACEVI